MTMFRAQSISPLPSSAGNEAQERMAGALAAYADRALLTELMLTPKPGLVDRRNCGAHHDMDMHTFLASARAIAPWWPRFVEIGFSSAPITAGGSLSAVRPVGVLCEQAMLRATKGINTHKGGIFSLGLLCFAAGRLLGRGISLTREHLCGEVARICVGLVDRELRARGETLTAGERVFRRYGVAGARGEAASGYSTVRTAALPVYDQLRLNGINEELTLLQVLLNLLAVNDDTNLLSRGGRAGRDYVRAYAKTLVGEGGVLAPDGLRKMAAFDDALIARHLSPGGTADLLGITWFLAQFLTHEAVEAQ
ncbi:triphosphoribosyl-dephospho-CoA synthase CitG [Bradyrhizobium sp. 197]|uniref:triphosphoribosyl-dephospho-CoA synthase CitG n=1 Tax=Bradyrhizobium sp. 197 TaxID=2782663 RepID=UPI001FF85812|nr:triphosphoribosyl-dephospho-CoA synthase CitG [Bradyrhizobium sp. 197]